MPTNYHPSNYTQVFAKHIHNLHVEIRQKIILSNDTYKFSIDAHRRHREFNKGIRICPKFYPKNAMKELHARTIGPYPIL